MAKKGTTKYKSNKQEKNVAKIFGGKQVIASGALWFAHSDVRSDDYLIECKTTEKDYYSLTAKTWEKVESEAIRDHMRIPLMVIDLEDQDRIIVFKPQDFGLDVSPIIMTEIPKSIRVRADMLGFNELGDYSSMFVTCICGKKNNVLCLMLQKDFEEIIESN